MTIDVIIGEYSTSSMMKEDERVMLLHQPGHTRQHRKEDCKGGGRLVQSVYEARMTWWWKKSRIRGGREQVLIPIQQSGKCGSRVTLACSSHHLFAQNSRRGRCIISVTSNVTVNTDVEAKRKGEANMSQAYHALSSLLLVLSSKRKVYHISDVQCDCRHKVGAKGKGKHQHTFSGLITSNSKHHNHSRWAYNHHIPKRKV